MREVERDNGDEVNVVRTDVPLVATRSSIADGRFMNSRNNRDQQRGPFSPAPLSQRINSERSAHLATGLSIQHMWRWSRNHVAQAASFLFKWVQRAGPVLSVEVGSRCIKGPVRETNEDRCYADQHHGLFIVADGMGGHAAGECASQAVIEVISSQLSAVLDDPVVSPDQLMRAMARAVQAANEELIGMAQADVTLSGMGAAVVVGVVWRNRLLLCSVGDSRAYLARHGELVQLTLDDTLVQGLVSAGALTAGEAARHPMRHVLVHSVCTRKLEKPLQVELHRLRDGDRLIFASDGLTDTFDHAELAGTCENYSDPRAAATALVDHAQQAGARDNITCIVVDLSV